MQVDDRVALVPYSLGLKSASTSCQFPDFGQGL